MTRESLWDDDARDLALGWIAYEESLCGCGCGLPVAEAYQAQPFKVDKVTCYAGRALAIARDNDAEAAKRNKTPDGQQRGVHYYVVVPDDADDLRGGTHAD